MPITIAGSGTITGISAGGLPDDSIIAADIAAGAVTTAKVADANITAAKLDGAQSGSAPIYAARAWVNFNGTSTVAIRASGNVSSITDNGTGQFVVNFSTAMPDANYSVVGSAGSATSAASDNAFAHLHIKNNTSTALQSGSVAVHTGYQDGNVTDYPVNTVAIFR